MVSKDEIIDAVWEGRFIAEATLTRSIADLRRALGDDQRAPKYIETIREARLPARRGDFGTVGGRRPESVSLAAELGRAGSSGPAVRQAAGSNREAGPTSGRIADRLASARRSRFVGREAEIELFRAALLADEPAFVALHITGAGGVGKTTLLQEFARVADEAGRAVVRIDGRNIEPSPLGSSSR